MVYIPKKRKHLGEMLHELASHKEAKIVEGHLMPDHIHMCISIPPKYSVSSVVGYLKGKSAIAIARRFGRERNFTGEVFWARHCRTDDRQHGDAAAAVHAQATGARLKQGAPMEYRS